MGLRHLQASPLYALIGVWLEAFHFALLPACCLFTYSATLTRRQSPFLLWCGSPSDLNAATPVCLSSRFSSAGLFLLLPPLTIISPRPSSSTAFRRLLFLLFFDTRRRVHPSTHPHLHAPVTSPPTRLIHFTLRISKTLCFKHRRIWVYLRISLSLSFLYYPHRRHNHATSLMLIVEHICASWHTHDHHTMLVRPTNQRYVRPSAETHFFLVESYLHRGKVHAPVASAVHTTFGL